MMLENKTAAIYGGAGAMGGAVARAFTGAGARVYLAGRSRARLEKVGWPKSPTQLSSWHPTAGVRSPAR
jgi:NAD(P)-dependent dehydrogenase (short-subunit alcohol dehydrogenase family)